MDLIEVKSRAAPTNVRHPWESARLAIIAEMIKKNNFIGDDSLILDIGCGDLFVIEYFAKAYPAARFVAVDTAFTKELIDYYAHSTGLSNLQLFASLDEALHQSKNKVHLVLLLDVIEHISDDIAFLKMLEKYPQIDSDTKIIITVPAFQWLFCAHDKFLGHYRRYTNKMLKRHVGEAGFSSISCGYFFFTLLPFRIMQLIKEKVFKATPQMTTDLVEWKGSKAVSGLLKNVLLADYKILRFFKLAGINIYGLSNYIVCRKPAS